MRILDPGRILINFVSKLFHQRHLIWNFVLRDLKSRYVGSMMGLFWSVVHPLVLLISYTFVFTVIFPQGKLFEIPANFPVFLFVGILPWLYFQDTVQRASSIVVESGNLIKKTVFPSEILPVALVISNLVTHLLGFIILLGVLFYYQTLGPVALLIPLYLFLLAVLALGLGWMAAALQVFLRDTAQVISVLMVLWFWFTPIFYQLDQVPDPYRTYIEFNPLSFVVEGYRNLLLKGQLPDWSSVLWLALYSLVAFVLGGSIFRATKREFADVL